MITDKEKRGYNRFMAKRFPVDKIADALKRCGSIDAAADILNIDYEIFHAVVEHYRRTGELKNDKEETMNDENLIPMSKRSPSEAREMGKAGGKASGKARQEKKLFREAVLTAIKAKTEGGGTVLTELVESLIKRALQGDPRAFEILRDTSGEKPTDKVEANVTNDNKELMREYLNAIKRGNS